MSWIPMRKCTFQLKTAQASISCLQGALFKKKPCGFVRMDRSAFSYTSNASASSTFHSCRLDNRGIQLMYGLFSPCFCCIPPFTFSSLPQFLCSPQQMAICFYCKQRPLISHQGTVLLHSSCRSIRKLKQRAEPIIAFFLYLGQKDFRKASAIPTTLRQGLIIW